MSRIRNAVLAAALVTGVAGAGVLAAAPAFAAPTATAGGGTMAPATGVAGDTLTMTIDGPVWNFSEPVNTVVIYIAVPTGATFTAETRVVDEVRYDLYPYSGDVWRLSLRASNPALKLGATSISIPSFPVTQKTPEALQGSVVLDLVQVSTAAGIHEITDEPQPSATFTWTAAQVDTPLIAPAIAGGAAAAALGTAGFVLVRRRRASDATA